MFLGFVAMRETILNGFTLDQFFRWLHVSNVLCERGKEGKNWHRRHFSTLEGMDGLRDSSTLKDDRTGIVFTATKEHCARFETRCRFHCCRRIFKNVTIVDVFGREKLNTPPLSPKTCIFILKCTILLVVSFDPRINEDRLFSCYFFFFLFSSFFEEGYRTEISMHGCANSSIVRLDLRINRYLR